MPASPALRAKRLLAELKRMHALPKASEQPAVRLLPSDDLDQWSVQVRGADATLYEGETFTLRLTFPPSYPYEAPEVVFTGGHIPVHPHVYSNGHICLSILYHQWSPALSVESLCLSILSMLSSCTAKERPPGDKAYVARARSPKNVNWWFHDDAI
ncbi:ubiquitin-conjugating enzyme E2 W [Coemansia interrupta]|uniref:Ubiquitin-conjugating enzyme E2 W n=1 Tax=Coemansia interrupta TaxID=1126814 RepID=A0A9W8HA04_9FUNG|nr:ubiquitin-conjugating enzyme E2 W [Coemansia interrupta]